MKKDIWITLLTEIDNIRSGRLESESVKTIHKDSHERGNSTKRASGLKPVLHISFEAVDGADHRDNETITSNSQ